MPRHRTPVAPCVDCSYPHTKDCPRPTWTHGKAYNHGCRCDDCTTANSSRVAAYFRSVGGNLHRTTYSYTCADCGEAGWSEKRQTLRCHTCHNRAVAKSRRTTRELVHVGLAPEYCPLPPSHPAMQAIPEPRLWMNGLCPWCGDTFTVRYQPAARYCSKKCRTAAGKTAHGKRFRVSPITRLAIYERDEWICQLCMDPVDPSLPPSDIWAATLDHIRCQSWAEKPDHSPENLRLAHRWCNSVRGDETYYSAEVLAS
jgi:DNA-directed RNA polymerase subunit RPC12/RpoP